MKMFKRVGPWFVATALLLFATAQAFAVPGDYEVTPMFGQPATGVPDGYRMYTDCDVATQAKGTLVGPVVSGDTVSIPGDSDTPPNTCVVAFNAAGEGPFDTVLTPTPQLQPPGPVQNFNLSCTFQETTASGNVFICIESTN